MLTHILVFPFKGNKGEYTLKNIKREINKILPDDKKIQLVYTETKLGTKINVNGKTKE